MSVVADHKLISLDVVSIFTNVPKELALNSIKKRYNFITTITPIPMKEYVLAISLILDSTFFTFNGTIYKQIFSTLMGSLLSPILADIVIQDLEEVTLASIDTGLAFNFKYVDDIIFTAPEKLLEKILTNFNSYHERLKFTMEIGAMTALTFSMLPWLWRI